jgi:hypothetical protein
MMVISSFYYSGPQPVRQAPRRLPSPLAIAPAFKIALAAAAKHFIDIGLVALWQLLP